MSELSLVERARLGQVDAIAALMNSSLHRLGIQARAAWQDNRLYVLLESAQPPDQRPCIEFIRQGLAQLQRIQAESAVVYGRGLGQTVPSWVQQIELTSPQPLTSPGKQVPDQVRGVPGIQPFAVDSLVVNPPASRWRPSKFRSGLIPLTRSLWRFQSLPRHIPHLPSNLNLRCHNLGGHNLGHHSLSIVRER
jgi:hypothetical protein